MVELHGWMCLSETYADEDSIPAETCAAVREKVRNILRECPENIRLQYVNGTAFLQTLFCANHRTQETDCILQTYQKIAETASGSYGVLYLRDDADKVYHNAFRVYHFRRGGCTVRTDEEFSPCIRKLEDAVF